MADTPFIWHEIYTPDVEATKSFYGKVLGWTTSEMDMGDFKYTMFAAGGEPFAGSIQMEGPDWEGVPVHWSTYVAVDDVDATVAKAKDAGGKLLHGPMDVPNVGRMALIQDPQGATIWFFKGAPQG